MSYHLNNKVAAFCPGPGLPLTVTKHRNGTASHVNGSSKANGANRDFLKALEQSQARLVSFDVFDTVITRKSGDPASIFHCVGQRLHQRSLIHCPPAAFSSIRHDCEMRIRANRQGCEVSLLHIYEEIAGTLQLDQHVAEMMEAELDEEQESIQAIPLMRETVNEVRSRIGRVIYISDMYLPGDFLRKILREQGLLMPGDTLYLSTEFGVQKGDGRLFQIALEIENLHPGELFHCGDSIAYDVKPAKALGIGVHHFTHAIPHPSEVILNNRSLSMEGFGSVMAGGARLARLAGAHLEPEARTVWETASSVTGPISLLFGMWIIERAKRAGIQQLYFLARDAYLPFVAVRALLAADPGSGLEAHYIHGSRHTYNLLGTDQLGPDDWDRLTTHGGRHNATISELCHSLMTDPLVFETHLEAIGLTEADRERELQTSEYERIRQHAIENAAFNRAIMDSIRSFKDLTRDYLAAMGFDPGKGVALVDSGWTTRSHAPLFNFLKAEKCANLRLFCLGVVMDETAMPIESIETFLFNRASRQGMMRRSVFYPRAAETLLLANHGRTVSFEKKEGKVHPVFSQMENAEFIRKHFNSYEAGFSEFIHRVIPHLPASGAHYDMRGLAESLIARFWLEPTMDEARLWSKLEWEWDPLGKITYPLARAYRMGDAWRAFVQKKYPDCHPQFWSGAALCLTSRFKRTTMRRVISLRWKSERLLRLLPSGPRSLLARIGYRLTRSQWPGF
jgi:FMN phosphatase YigB (HAD superfamily)